MSSFFPLYRVGDCDERSAWFTQSCQDGVLLRVLSGFTDQLSGVPLGLQDNGRFVTLEGVG